MSVTGYEDALPKKKTVRFGHEEFLPMDGADAGDPFLTLARPQIEEGGLIAADTRLHPQYSARSAAFDARRKPARGAEPSGIADPDEDEVAEAHSAEARTAQTAADQATLSAGLPTYSRANRKYIAEVANARSEQGRPVETFDDLLAGIDERAASDLPEAGDGHRDPSTFTLNARPDVPTDPAAARFHQRSRAMAEGIHPLRSLVSEAARMPHPGNRDRHGWGLSPTFLKATPKRKMYGSGENAEHRPTSFYPNAAWAVSAPGESETGQINTARPAHLPAPRSNRVLGQYFSTFRERAGAGAGFFGALFGFGMKRANARRQAAAIRPHLERLAAARSVAPQLPDAAAPINSRAKLTRKAERMAGRGFTGRTAEDLQENFAWRQEDMGYRVANNVGGVIAEATPEDEDADA